MSGQTESIPSGTADVRKPLVLVVDDDRVSRKLMRKTLVRENFAVVEAENGEQALAVFDAQCPDIVLLDVEMPVMDGFTACMKLRERKSAEHVPVLMVTGLEDTESVNRAYDAGATDFITKPLNWPILGHRIRYMLRSSETVAKLAYTVGELDNSRIRLTNAQRIAQLGSWEIDTTSMTMSWSDEVYRILGLDPGCSNPSVAALLDVVHEEDREQLRHWFSLALKTGEAHSINHRVLGPKESSCNVFQQVWAVVDEDGAVIELHGTIQDLTERQKFENKIRELAYFDSLTGLPNRESFMMHVTQSIKSAKRHQENLAALFLDLDNFKRINDTLGHSAGDLALKAIAERLEDCLRGSDVVARIEEDTVSHMVSRFGGDEFTLLLSDLRDNEDAAVVAQRILDTLSQPLNLAGHEIVITPTIGIAVYPQDGDTREILFRNADTAMYCAKRRGKNSFQFYDNHMNVQARERLTMENQLRKALERNELTLHYQPQLDIDSSEIVGVEALLRWHNEELGNVPPDDFIPVAEDSGLIHPIGEWVLRTACAQVKAWQDTGVPIRRVAVNISARQFAQRGFLQLINQVLDDTGLAPECLELEITESLLMQDMEGAIALMDELKQLGVLLAIDDFGTGYSSLSYLKRFPVDRLKVDQSFINEITTNTEDSAITMALIAMADTLDLRVIAEGVETKEQLDYLTEKCCHEIQGYYLSHPVPAYEISAFIDAKKDAKAGQNTTQPETLSRKYISPW